MSRPIEVLDIAVVFAPLIGVADQDRQTSARGSPLEDPRQDLGRIGFITLGRDVALTGAATVHVDKQIVDRQRNPRRYPINNDDVARPVTLASGGDAECLSK